MNPNNEDYSITSMVINLQIYPTTEIDVSEFVNEFKQRVLKHIVDCIYNMTDIAKEAKKTEQDAEAKLKTEKDHAEGKPSSETLNKAKVKTEDALT